MLGHPRHGDLERDYRVFREAGDPAALARVFDAAAPELLRVAVYLSGDPHVAEDLVQATFLVAMRKRHQFADGQRVMPWLLGILAHRVRAHRRRAGRRPDPERCPRERVVDPLSVAQERELAAAVGLAISRLPEAYQPVLRLCLRHGHSAREIARELGRSRGTVRSQLSRGMELLRRLLPAGFAAVLGSSAAVLPSRLAAMRGALVEQSASLSTTPCGAGSAAATGRGFGPKALAVALPAAVVLLAAWQMATPRAAPQAPVEISPRAGQPLDRTLAPRAPVGVTAREPVLRARRQARVRVAVVDADGLPVPGARVMMHPEGPRGVLRAEWRVAGPDGVATFDGAVEGDHRLVGLCGGERTAVVALGENEVVLQVPRGRLVAGTVLDADGRALAGAEVYVALPGERSHVGAVATRANASGEFVLRDLRRGRSLSALAPGRVPSEKWRVAAPPGVTRDVVLRCGGAAGVVEGVVRGPQGRPVAGAVVQLGALDSRDRPARFPSVVVRTDGQGGFRCGEAPPGPLPVWIAAPGLAAHWEVVAVEAGQRVEVEVRLLAGGSATGSVRDEGGDSLPGAMVRTQPRDLEPMLAVGPSWAYPAAACDGDGAYRLPAMRPGPVELLALRPLRGADGYRVVSSSLLEVQDRQELRWNARFGETVAWDAVLVDEWEAPLAGWEVLLSVVEPGDMSRVFVATTDVAGRFRVATPVAGEYELRLREPGAVLREPLLLRSNLRWSAMSRIVVPDRCRATASVSGVVLARSGAPAPGETVTLSWRERGAWREVARAEVGADGCFELGPVPPGEYAVGLGSAASERVVEAVSVTAHGATDLGVLRLR